MDDSSMFERNRELNKREFEERRLVLESWPLSLRVILTNRCNINCIMCGIGDAAEDVTIPRGLLGQLEEFFPYLERIDWQGGEVFMAEHFRELLSSAARHPNIRQTIQTNGLFLTPEWVEPIATGNVSLLVSIDSLRKETYEYIRAGARFETMMDGVRRLAEARARAATRARAVLCVCLMRSNYREIEAFVDFAARYGFGQIAFGFLHGERVPEERIFEPLDEEAAAFLRAALPRIEAKCRDAGIVLETYFRRFIERLPATAMDAAVRERRPVFCSLPWTNMAIDAIRGMAVYPECTCTREIGDIRERSLRELWNGSRMQEYRRSPAFCTTACPRRTEEHGFRGRGTEQA